MGKMFPSNVLISLEAEKNPLSLIENPHKSPFRNFFLCPFKSRQYRACPPRDVIDPLAYSKKSQVLRPR